MSILSDRQRFVSVRHFAHFVTRSQFLLEFPSVLGFLAITVISYRQLFVALAEARIRYLVAGGVAVNLHQVQWATADLDLILHLERENLLHFAKLMSEGSGGK